jgi:hypothetical protein
MCVVSYGAKCLKLSNLVEIHTSQVYAYHNIWFGFQTLIEPMGGSWAKGILSVEIQNLRKIMKAWKIIFEKV